jgi:hypothetical protein
VRYDERAVSDHSREGAALGKSSSQLFARERAREHEHTKKCCSGLSNELCRSGKWMQIHLHEFEQAGVIMIAAESQNVTLRLTTNPTTVLNAEPQTAAQRQCT